MQDRPFTARKFNKNTWVIEGVGCYSYLVLGDKSGMLVDTGMSRSNLKEFVQTITELPIQVVNTHGHFDHTGGNGWFDVCYMHPNAVEDAKNAFGGAKEFPLDYKIVTVTSGYTFDLGGRTLEVIEIPAHNGGSIALLDKENRLLFSGDELECGQVLLMLDGSSSVEDHQKNMKLLKERINEFDYICPGHNGTPIDKSYVDIYIENDQKVLDGVEGSMDINSPSLPEAFMKNNGYFRRSEYKGSSIVYDIRRIHS